MAGTAEEEEARSKRLPFACHLLVSRPEKRLQAWCKKAKCTRAKEGSFCHAAVRASIGTCGFALKVYMRQVPLRPLIYIQP